MANIYLYCTTCPFLLAFFCHCKSCSKAHSVLHSFFLAQYHSSLSLSSFLHTSHTSKHAYMCICTFVSCTHIPGSLKLWQASDKNMNNLTSLCYDGGNPDFCKYLETLSFGRLFLCQECRIKQKNNDRKYAKSNTNTIQICQPNSCKQIVCNPCQLGELGHWFRLIKICKKTASIARKLVLKCCTEKWS